jgi:hypothetical protein
MRTLRMEKLAGMRKVADSNADIDKILNEMFADDLFSGYGGDFDQVSSAGKEEIRKKVKEAISNGNLTDKSFYDIVRGTFLTDTKTQFGAPNKTRSGGDGILGANGTDFYFNKLKGLLNVGPAQSDADVEFPPVSIDEDRENYIYNAKTYGSSKTEEELGSFYDSEVKKLKEKANSSTAKPNTQKGGGSTKPQTARAPARPLVINHPEGSRLQDKTYLYEVMDPGNKFKWQLLSDKNKTGIFERSSVSADKWNRAVNVLNSLAPISTPSAAPATAAAPTTPPAGTTETASPSGGNIVSNDPQLVSNVAIILQKASTRAYAMTVPGNQKKQIREMLQAAVEAAAEAGIEGEVNPSQFLANLIITKRGSASFSGIGKIQDISSLSRGDIKSNAKEEVRMLMEAINELYTLYGGGNPAAMKAKFRAVITRGLRAKQQQQQPPTSSTAAASFDPRIKKLAKLRRLRVRSQMEAAIEPSAKLGRSRIS